MLNVDNSHLVQCSTIVGWQHEISIGAALVDHIDINTQKYGSIIEGAMCLVQYILIELAT